ncbi:MAG: methionine--tRNA ligase [Methanobrevibacter sp.]|uniref:methionine--tRNA ligase n=1 Tax=Methanobrevibacter sp. TaxID=66852 RepID=UPI0026DF7561|nr:methionine--tRNA ligase [Methanobrevibacter sp.]MDO5849248.1 methionine--tRNA ligase [Methanobrevibacter sp.]
MSKIFISCALPYANGPCHLGHLRSTYLPADIYARYNRMIGNDVLMVCATDEHGTPIAVKADNENKKPIEISKRYHDMIAEDIRSMNISLDNFTRTTDKKHYDIAQNFFLDLYNKGYIYKKDITQLYCENCNKFLPDRYVQGLCPVCGSEARGDHCEKCGRHLEPTELKEPECLTCGSTPVIKDTYQYFFKLSDFQDDVEEYIDNNEYLPPNVKNYAKNWLKEGLNDWVLTRDMDWGIPVPLDEAIGKVIYVWGEAFLGYISSAAQWSEETGISWKDYWDDYVVHFIGKDIIYHHAIFWPALLAAHGCKMPDNIYAGEFLSLEGQKMSTSKNWVVWIADFVKEFDPDLLRYYLTINAPLNKDTDFSWKDFQRRNNDGLADVIGNFLHRTFTFTHKFFDGKVPEYKDPSVEDLEFEKSIEELPDNVGELIANYDFREGLLEIFRVAKLGNKYFNDQEPWKAVKENPQKAANTLYLSNQLAKTLAVVLKPYIPTKADAIAEIINIDIPEKWDDAKVALPTGHEINKAKPLFKKIDDDVIDAQIIKLNETLKNNEDENMSDIITIDDFDKVEIKIGQIKEAEKIEKSDKLLKLQVDIGDEVRQIVAGLAKFYAPEELIDRKVAVVVNLKPAKLFGTLSEGMILATGESGALLTPDECEVGERIQ